MASLLFLDTLLRRDSHFVLFYFTDNGIEILANKILSIVSDYPNVDLLLAGDFNASSCGHGT